MKSNKIIYSFRIEDIQTVAEDKLEKKLSDKEMGK